MNIIGLSDAIKKKENEVPHAFRIRRDLKDCMETVIHFVYIRFFDT